jgi:hypothetical protein
VDIFTTTTTTNTDLLTQVYNLVGVPGATAVPEPPAWTLLGAGLLGLGCIFRQRIDVVRASRRAPCPEEPLQAASRRGRSSELGE